MSTRPAPDPLAPEEALPPPSEPSRRLGVRSLFAALALAFFLGPALVIVVGHSGGPLAREQAVARPSLSEGWDFFASATRYLTQELPGRQRALDANDWISNNVFGEAPRYGTLAQGDTVLPFGGVDEGKGKGGYAQTGGARGQHPITATGRDGWLFLQGEIDIACKPPVSFPTAVERWDRFVEIVRASGRKVILLVAPEKSTIYPEQVAPSTAWWKCSQRRKGELWSEIEAIRNPNVVPLRQRMRDLKREHGPEPVYEPLGSHWNDIGALELVRIAVDRVGGGIEVKPSEVREGTRDYQSDLSPFAGQGKKTRPGPSRTIARAGGAPVLQGTTLFLHDSYGDAAAPLLAPYASKRFVNATFLALNPRLIVGLLRRSDTVIVETVERDFLNRAALGIEQSVLTPAFLRALPAKLGPPP